MRRQKSFSEISRSASKNDKKETPRFRSKTPDPNRRNVNNSRKIEEISACNTILKKGLRKTESLQSVPNLEKYSIKAAASVVDSGLNSLKPNITNADLLSQEKMDVKYNAYCQANLLVHHTKAIQKQKEMKVIQEIENLELSLLELEEKRTALNVDLEKIRFFKTISNNLQKKIDLYEEIIESTNEEQLDEYIHALEQDLSYVQLKGFNISDNQEEKSMVVKNLQELEKKLSNVEELKEKLQPLIQLHSSCLEMKKNVQEEEKLKISCEENLKLAEELVYHYGFLKSLGHIN